MEMKKERASTRYAIRMRVSMSGSRRIINPFTTINRLADHKSCQFKNSRAALFFFKDLPLHSNMAREKNVDRAKLSEQAERYDDMAKVLEGVKFELYNIMCIKNVWACN